ncbi:HDOD domain-containing protein [Bythopirellula polymerisocia]|uniref:HDOD domain protein n=1 Tax=Bythopirellula polymerisocia TaxID=2528003 RepID=A0A5C6D0B8_9BACT|nr:HDOD domain-containing protein [Bythopirellula polymerisocia]TWU30158.1 HDOD domain protein [Bythopirellula polymerisocia]
MPQCISSLPPSEPDTATMERFVLHAKSLYSLPVVAAEVLELTASSEVDTVALNACIERDPALTVRLLRVVNSSLFGLSHPVSDLNQAITMLGIKPLKLLVLGFSLPESLFANLAREQLESYWSTTLIRAVSAREISEHWFQRSGDEAFLAGLLQDIGILALIGQFRDKYTHLMSRAIEKQVDLTQIETETLGFDHLALSAALLDHWNMPTQLGRSITNIRKGQIHASGETSTDHLTRVLQLASLLGELVGRHRLSVLPELLELGGAYCELDKSQLTKLVAELQPKVELLAEVLSLELPESREYTEILVAAHGQISALVDEDEESLNEFALCENDVNSQVRKEANRLKIAVNAFLRSAPAKVSSLVLKVEVESPEESENHSTGELPFELFSFDRTFEQRLVVALGKCRSQRQALSVVMLEVSTDNQEGESNESLLSRLMDTACRVEFCSPLEVEVSSPTRRVLVLGECDRQEAVHMARGAIQSIEATFQRHKDRREETRIRVSGGVASVFMPSKNFEPSRLLQTADRCLAGARTCGTSSVKSLEIY